MLVLVVAGGGGGGESQFTPDQVNALLELIDHKNALVGVATQAIQTINITLDTFGTSIDQQGVIIPVKYIDDGYRVISPVEVEDDNNDDLPEYLINVPGYACGIECYVWLDNNNTIVSNTMERCYPKLLYDPTKGQYGTTQIFLNKVHEYDVINALPLDKRIIKISYIQLTSKK